MRPWFRYAHLVRLTVFSIVMLACSAHAQASVIYTYTGNPFDFLYVDGSALNLDPHHAGDSVAGFIELSAPLAANLVDAVVTPVAFSFTDGVTTHGFDAITNLNATYTNLRFWTDGSGQISDWHLQVGVAYLGFFGGFVRTIYTQTSSLGGDQDYGSDTQCGITSSPWVCVAYGFGAYRSDASLINAPGSWEVRSVPEPGMALLIGTAFVAFVRRQR